MAHELATVNGSTSMMFVGEVPWHGLGTKLDSPATARETIEAAGLNYEVTLSDMTTTGGIPIPSRKAVVRTDTNDVLGVVGNSYVPVQNRQAFGFLDAIAAEGGIRYHTAGALRRGERIWLLGKLPGSIRVKNSEDVTEKYLLLSNSPWRLSGKCRPARGSPSGPRPGWAPTTNSATGSRSSTCSTACRSRPACSSSTSSAIGSHRRGPPLVRVRRTGGSPRSRRWTGTPAGRRRTRWPRTSTGYSCP